MQQFLFFKIYNAYFLRSSTKSESCLHKCIVLAPSRRTCKKKIYAEPACTRNICRLKILDVEAARYTLDHFRFASSLDLLEWSSTNLLEWFPDGLATRTIRLPGSLSSTSERTSTIVIGDISFMTGIPLTSGFGRITWGFVFKVEVIKVLDAIGRSLIDFFLFSPGASIGGLIRIFWITGTPIDGVLGSITTKGPGRNF